MLHVQHVSARAATCGIPQPSGERRQTPASMYVPAFGSVSTMRTLYARKCASTQAEIVVQLKIDVFIGGIVVIAPSTSCEVFVDASVRSPILARNEPLASRLDHGSSSASYVLRDTLRRLGVSSTSLRAFGVATTDVTNAPLSSARVTFRERLSRAPAVRSLCERFVIYVGR